MNIANESTGIKCIAFDFTTFLNLLIMPVAKIGLITESRYIVSLSQLSFIETGFVTKFAISSNAGMETFG